MYIFQLNTSAPTLKKAAFYSKLKQSSSIQNRVFPIAGFFLGS